MKPTEKPRLLIVDDEKNIRSTLAAIMDDEGWASDLAASGAEAITLFKRNSYDLVLLDVWMPGIDGIHTLQKIKQLSDQVPIVIMSGHGTIETAVRATKLGAFDYLEKPLSLDKILPLLEHALEIREHNSQQNESVDLPSLIGSSEVLLKIKRLIKMVAPRNSWVLITGENGTGKEVVARHIHHYSSRSHKPFVAVNCAAIPEDLIESELFGHVKGAFTNAVATKRGKFELADGGTLFLDEIGDMSLKTQAKILRILQEQKFERIGATDTISVDVRVIAATNKKLDEEIKNGNFREDLYYRLNVIPFQLPPLRVRGDDLDELVNYFFGQMSTELKEPKKRIDEDALSFMKRYGWPGNIRELRNLLERLCIIISGEVIRKSDLVDLIPMEEPVHANSSLDAMKSSSTLKEAKTDFERAFILDKLDEYSWNITKTAEAIGVERSNLHRKMKLYNIDPKSRGES